MTHREGDRITCVSSADMPGSRHSIARTEERLMSSRARLRRARGGARLQAGIDHEMSERGGTSDGAVLVAVEREARRRVEGGSVWSLGRYLADMDLLDEDARAVINGVVAHRVSDHRHDVRAK